MTPSTPTLLQRATRRSRWTLAYAWGLALLVYVALIAVSSAHTAVIVNDIVWSLAAGAAALVCFRTARRLQQPDRRAWSLIAIGCTSWFVGQLHWNYVQLVLGVGMPYPNLGQILYSAFAACVIAGVLHLSETRTGEPLTLRHAGNVGLVVCCLGAAIVMGLLEPALRSKASRAFLFVGTFHAILLAGTFLVTLFALWTYRWNRSWTAILLIALGSDIYSATNLIYSYSLLTGTYVVGDLINGSWVLVFGLVAWAAHERWWFEEHPMVEAPRQMQARERWLEAIVPALLIVIMIGVALAVGSDLTPRALLWGGCVFILFALILGLREAWIQADALRLHDELHEANKRLATANSELRANESRYRELNAMLERRVVQRNDELGRAYGELESFAYAVAHDLKAPLRSINSFAQLLRAHLGEAAPATIHAHLDRIKGGSLQMAELIDDLLAYSHVEHRTLNAGDVDLDAMIARILAHQADDIRRRNVAVQIDVQIATLFVDADGLNLVLRNLIENALKYSRDDVGPSLRIRALRRGNHAVFEVADNGIGFDMQYHDQIFKIFQRLHRDERYPGTGIGLALVRKAVQRMRGRVWAESRIGDGTTFFVELPMTAEKVALA